MVRRMAPILNCGEQLLNNFRLRHRLPARKSLSSEAVRSSPSTGLEINVPGRQDLPLVGSYPGFGSANLN